MESQKTVTAYLKSKRSPPFDFARQDGNYYNTRPMTQETEGR